MQTQHHTRSRGHDALRGAATVLLAATFVAACGAKASPTPGTGANGSAGPNSTSGAQGSGGAGQGPGGSLAPGASGDGGNGNNGNNGNNGGSAGGTGGGGTGGGGTGGGSGTNPGTGTSNSTGTLGQLEQAYEAVVEKISPSVVVIETAEGLGSGIVFDAKGNIVTNAHVVGTATQFRVTLSDGSQAPATLVGTYPANDIAVIRVDPSAITRPGTSTGAGGGASPGASTAPGASAGPNATGPDPTLAPNPTGSNPTPTSSDGGTATSGLVPATFADSSRLRVGQIVLAVGNPLGLQSSVTNGIVSSLGRTVTEPGGATIPGMVQTSAAINPGNSGGALVDISGNVVGIPTLAAADPQFGGAAPGIGFAIPANDAKDFANQLIANGKVTNTHRAYLGIRSADVNVDAVLVYGIQEGGPAAQSGIRAGDLIVSIDGRPTRSAADLSAILAQFQPGQTVAVEVVREDGSRTTIRVILGQLPG